MTSVDEWTSAETGVGAAMALGSQPENGVMADLVIAAKSRAMMTDGDWIQVRVDGDRNQVAMK